MIRLLDDSMIRKDVSKLVTRYQDLIVYQRAFAVAIEIHKETLNFPKIEQYEIASQMRRASKGICANIAEGFGKQSSSPAEFRRFLSMAIGSANEMRVWVDFCSELGYITKEVFERWQDHYDAIARMLTKLKS